jgi:CheY-like chemotaxis protein
MRVAIVDDRAEDLLTLEGELEEAGHQAIAREMPLPSLDVLVEWLESQGAEALVCDQRLSAAHYAAFHGAEAISHVLDRLRLPSLLVSSFIDTDGITAIRRWRDRVPVLIGKALLTPDAINRGFELCQSELEGDVPPQRVPRRTGVHIESVYQHGTDLMVEVIVPGWNPHSAVSFPIDLVTDEHLRARVRERAVDWVIAKVNVDAETAEELFFVDFEIAPDPADLGVLGVT